MKFVSLIIFVLLSLTGCHHEEQIRLVTTTTIQDSGFAEALKRKFESATGLPLLVVSRGSAEALELGRRGDGDVLLTHSPEEEKQFIADGYGISREFVMANEFVLVGPSKLKEHFEPFHSIIEVLKSIPNSSIRFISRGDNSGTHIQERKLWESIPLEPNGDWYLKSGSGMGTTLRIANEKRACTLCDRATYIALSKNLDLEIVFEPKPKIQNEYHLMAVKNSKTDPSKIDRFRQFLFSPETQNWINSYGKKTHGETLFYTE